MRRAVLGLVSWWIGVAAIGCSSGDSDSTDPDGADPAMTGDPPVTPGSDGTCEPGLLAIDGSCVPPERRHEPAERIDFDNVVQYGDDPLTLDLPEPPKSGFRLVVSPMQLGPGKEFQTCVAWAYPELTHKNIYAARLYTTGMLHHSNMYGVPYAPDLGESPYPGCNDGQASVFSQVGNLVAGDIMDVLFANSTQIRDGEAIVFSPGMAFKIQTEGREVATSIHWLNTTDEPFTSEVVYDFFTIPDDLVETEIVPFVFEIQEFEVPPMTTEDVVMTCDLGGSTGNIVSIMPHTHERASEFVVDLLDESGNAERIFTRGGFDTESDITVLEEPVSLAGFSQIQHRCTVENDLNEPIIWGTGTNEMCTFFGYLYPPEAQHLGYIARGSTACLSVNIGAFRQ